MCTRPREGQRLGDRGRGGEPTETNAGVVRQTGTSKGVCDHNPRTGNAPRARREPPEVKHLVIKHRPQEVWGQVARRFMTDVDVRRPEEVTTARGSLPRRLSPVCAHGKDPACVPGPSSKRIKAREPTARMPQRASLRRRSARARVRQHAKGRPPAVKAATLKRLYGESRRRGPAPGGRPRGVTHARSEARG